MFGEVRRGSAMFGEVRRGSAMLSDVIRCSAMFGDVRRCSTMLSELQFTIVTPIRIRLVRLWEWGVTVLPSSLLELPFQRQFLEGSINFRLQRPEIILPLVSRVIPTKIRTILSSRSDGYIYIELIIRMPQGGAVSGWHHQGETRRVGIIKGKYINEPSSQR